MKRFIGSFLALVFASTGFSQSLKDLSWGQERTLDIMTWNIEWFPKNDQRTADSVTVLIRAFDAEVIALQEISDTVLFRKAVEKVGGYDVRFASGNSRGLAYVFKTEGLGKPTFKRIYPFERTPFPRAPFVMEMTYAGKKYVLINNHLKCCGNGQLDRDQTSDEENRRWKASELMKTYIDREHPDDAVIVLGDLNDLIAEKSPHNVFEPFLNDSKNYRFADMAIAEGSKEQWSYPGWPSHLDHLLVTNELFEALERPNSRVATLRIGDFMKGGFDAYDDYISDHRPVAMSLVIDGVGSKDVKKNLKPSLTTRWEGSALLLTSSDLLSGGLVHIHSIDGRLMISETITGGQDMARIDASPLSKGNYVLSFQVEGQTPQKVVFTK